MKMAQRRQVKIDKEKIIPNVFCVAFSSSLHAKNVTT